MSELSRDDIKLLEDSAIHTRFNWAILFFTLATLLVGLLAMIEPYNSTSKSLFNIVISIIYFVLTIGLSYAFYAICQTSFIIDKLIVEHESEAVQIFLRTYWRRKYTKLFCTIKEKDAKKVVEFRTKTVIFLSIIVIVISVLPLLFKLGLFVC